MVPDLSGYDPTWDSHVLRNATILRAAEGMRKIDQYFQAAWRFGVDLERQLEDLPGGQTLAGPAYSFGCRRGIPCPPNA
jgi:hypothetical protein